MNLSRRSISGLSFLFPFSVSVQEFAMSIKVECQCGQKFAAKDSMAGKRVKCPKCNQALVIPSGAQPEPRKWGAGATAASPVLDLLDEAGVQHARTGPQCPECDADLPPEALICIQCGYNVQTGRRMDTVGEEDMENMTDAQKMIAKAEQEIEDTPITAEGQDYGDGPESFILAIVALTAMVIIVGIAVGLIYFLDVFVGEAINPPLISFWVGILMYIVGRMWIIIVAFLQHVGHGLGALFCELYAIYFGISRIGALWAPTVSMVLGGIVSGACYAYLAAQK